MRYKSKIDLWFYVVLVALSAATVAFIMDAALHCSTFSLVAATAFVLVEGFLLLPIWLNTAYILEDNALRVNCGLCTSLVIPYDSILSIRPARQAQSAAALSLDRLGISYDTGEYSGNVLISPQNKENFLHELYLRML